MVCAVCAARGNLHLINGLYDRQRSRVPVVVIAAQILERRARQLIFSGNPPWSIYSAQCSHYQGIGVER